MQALPTPNWGTGEAEQYVAPPSAAEAQVQAIWQDVLGLERVSTQADFFAAGGNSLQVRPQLTQRGLCCLRSAISAISQEVASSLVSSSAPPCFLQR